MCRGLGDDENAGMKNAGSNLTKMQGRKMRDRKFRDQNAEVKISELENVISNCKDGQCESGLEKLSSIEDRGQTNCVTALPCPYALYIDL